MDFSIQSFQKPLWETETVVSFFFFARRIPNPGFLGDGFWRPSCNARYGSPVPEHGERSRPAASLQGRPTAQIADRAPGASAKPTCSSRVTVLSPFSHCSSPALWSDRAVSAASQTPAGGRLQSLVVRSGPWHVHEETCVWNTPAACSPADSILESTFCLSTLPSFFFILFWKSTL